MRLLLHACCGPCSLESTRVLLEEGHSFDIFYCNPNIHPADEYERRREALRDYVAEPLGIELIEGAYDPQTWEERAGIYGTDTISRCRQCYRIRFERLAAKAAELGYEGICTTLTISPYQYTNMIFEELRRAAEQHGIAAVEKDFSPYFDETTRRSRENGMYRQNYCGCRLSKDEADAGRARRREERKRRKEEAKALNLNRLEADVIDQIIELQIKLGYARETARLYYRANSLASLIGADPSLSPAELAALLRAAPMLGGGRLGHVVYGTHEDRVELTIPPEGVEYVHRKVQPPEFLVELIELFMMQHHPSKESILGLFAKYSDSFVCEDVPEDAGFDYAVHFEDSSIDSHFYCFKEEMGHVIYHRFVKEDYLRLFE